MDAVGQNKTAPLLNRDFYFWFCVDLIRPAKYYENDLPVLTSVSSKLLRIKRLLGLLVVAAPK